MSEYHTKEECLTAVQYAKYKGIAPEIVKAAVKRAQGLVVQVESRRVPIIISTGRKNSTPKINPVEAAQAKFAEIIKQTKEAKK